MKIRATTFILAVLSTSFFAAAQDAGIVYAEKEPGASFDQKVNACITAAISSGAHICDAYGLGGSQSIAAQINVGTTSQQAVSLLLAPSLVATVTITDGVSCALKQFGNTSISSPGPVNNVAVIQAASSANLSALYCTDKTQESYTRMEGVNFYSPSDATFAAAAVDIEDIVDNSTYRNIQVANYKGIGILIQNACCGAEFDAMTSNGGGYAGAIPLELGTNVCAVTFNAPSIDHPGAGLNNIVSTGIGNSAVFNGLYMETSSTDTTTPLISLSDTNLMVFNGIVVGSLDSNSAYVISNSGATGRGGLTVSGLLRGGSSHGYNGVYDTSVSPAVNYQVSTAETGSYSNLSSAWGNMRINGNLSVSGSITAGTKDFKIDHPLDPANKYLYHASVESSEMMNIYTGNATLNAKGRATIQLPDWFEALNADFRYELTSVGRPQPALHISEEVSHNRFKIAGGKPNGRVSWQVTGVRHDAYARAYPVSVEEDKPLNEQGHYLHPELFGAPAQSSLGYRMPSSTPGLSPQADSVSGHASK